jgi:hypothetical protein
MDKEKPVPVLVNEREAAAVLGVALQTVRNWRFLRQGPNYVKFAHSVRYDMNELNKFVDQHRINLQEG